ncbi:MAG: hypothetical protein F9K38_16345 [Pseudorhodoplanes sp.]|nr:MAG: hypothetical protein F9K38_16345 [Pseudorhodoplanes sp.]
MAMRGKVIPLPPHGPGGAAPGKRADSRHAKWRRPVVACRLRRLLRQIAPAERALVRIAPGNTGYPAAMSQAIGGGFEKQPKSRRRAQARYYDSSKYRPPNDEGRAGAAVSAPTIAVTRARWPPAARRYAGFMRAARFPARSRRA